MTRAIRYSGHCPPRYHDVARAFEENFADGAETGAAFAVLIDGEPVVDIRGGGANRTGAPWTSETIACVFSSGKAVTAYLIARAISNGTLDYERAIAADWPAFAAEGKGAITLAEALSHQAGLCGFHDEMPSDDWLDWDAICTRIADQAPLWPPGTANGYHPQTIGFIAGELLRRATGRSVGTILREDFYRRDGIDIHCGFGDDIAERTAQMQKPPRAPDLGVLNRYKEAAFLKPWSAPARVSREAWMAAELPASNMHASARGLASIMQPMACGGDGEAHARLDPAVVREALRVRIEGDDLVLPFHLEWGAGLMRNSHGGFGPDPDVWGHAGSGGSCVIVDPERRLTAAYVMNRMSPHLVGDPRARRVLKALYSIV